nr:MAG TPA: DNA directed RNA polymerase subunit [Bacteriophage sp.]
MDNFVEVVEIKGAPIPDALKMYLKSIRQYPLLTAEEEQKIAKNIANGDEAARKRMVEANLRLVVSIAKSYTGRVSNMTLMDLIQEGNVGLMRATEKFDVDKGFRFSTYATYWIKQAISKAVIEQNRAIRLPNHIINEMNKFNKAQRELTQQLCRKPTMKELATALGVPVKKVKQYFEYSQEPTSLDVTINEDEDVTAGELVADATADKFAEFDDNSTLKAINSVLETLPDREKLIIEMRFGLNGYQSSTLEQVGEKLNLTKERIRQLEASAIKKLRNPARASLLKDYLEL